ncbi:MAG: hypothetical protein JO211_08590 [Acidobacteriaceae bacterium]|nr:hypothetical protein [Acidobacteriaceae bacterium]
MLFSRSTDSGLTWSSPLKISTHPGLPRDDNGSLGGYFQAIAADGSIYAIWNDGNSITLAESHDGGRSFRRPHSVIETGPPYFGDVPGISRVEGFAEIAVSSAREKHPPLYIAWSDYRNGDVDVFLASSSDGGRKWSAPVRVNDDPLHNGCDQFYQSLAVDPATGYVYLLFYDRRADSHNRAIKLTLARSTNGGQTFSNYALTTTAFDGRAAFLGDYTWLTAFRDRVYGVWTETAPDSHDRPETIIYCGRANFAASHHGAEQ